MFFPELSVPFYHFYVKEWDIKKKKLMDLYSKIKDNLVYDNSISSVYTDYLGDINQNNNYISEVVQILKEELNEFINVANIEENVNINCWFQKYTKGCFHSPHNHSTLGYSSVCFIDYDENEHKPPRFISPFFHPLDGSVMEYSPENIKSGSIIFFPASLVHYVLPNTSSKIRIILSMNIKKY